MSTAGIDAALPIAVLCTSECHLGVHSVHVPRPGARCMVPLSSMLGSLPCQLSCLDLDATAVVQAGQNPGGGQLFRHARSLLLPVWPACRHHARDLMHTDDCPLATPAWQDVQHAAADVRAEVDPEQLRHLARRCGLGLV